MRRLSAGSKVTFVLVLTEVYEPPVLLNFKHKQ